MNKNQSALAMGIPPLHQHGAFDDLDAALWNIQRLSNALLGISKLLQPEGANYDEQLNMVRRSEASAVFDFFGEVLNDYRGIADDASNTLRHEAERVAFKKNQRPI